MRIACVFLMLFVVGCASRDLESIDPHRQRMRAERLHNDALDRVEAGEAQAAEQALRAAIDADPFHGLAHANLGALLLQKRELYEAAWHLRYAAKLMPRASQPRANLGLLYATAGQADKAEAQLREALELNPTDLDVVGHLVRIHIRYDRITPETEGWLQRLAVEDPDPGWRAWAARQRTRIASQGAIP